MPIYRLLLAGLATSLILVVAFYFAISSVNPFSSSPTTAMLTAFALVFGLFAAIALILLASQKRR